MTKACVIPHGTKSCIGTFVKTSHRRQGTWIAHLFFDYDAFKGLVLEGVKNTVPLYMASTSIPSFTSIWELVIYRPSASSSTVWTLRRSCWSLSIFSSRDDRSMCFLIRKEMNLLSISPEMADIASSIIEIWIHWMSGHVFNRMCRILN